jgi:hypothetical protein
VGGYVCGLSKTNGKTEKVAEIVDTQGFAFSVFIPFFVPFWWWKRKKKRKAVYGECLIG